MRGKVTIKTLLVLTFVVAAWCQAAPVVGELGRSGYSILKSWIRNGVMHERIEEINTKAGRTTWTDRLK